MVGVDVCRGGWVFLRLADGKFESARFYRKFADGVEVSPDAEAIGVDIPIGYPPWPATRRLADCKACEMVGPLRSSVFPTPHPDLLEQSWQDARRISRDRFGRGLTKQSYDLRLRIKEVASVAARHDRVYEVHPEVSFVALANHQHLKFTKKKWNGHNVRRALLVAHRIKIPDVLDDARRVGADDILDAAAAAWSARRIAKGQAVPLPDPPECDGAGRGRRVAIWY